MKIRKLATISLLVLSSFAASGVAPSKTELEAMYDKAFREFDANNYEQALKDLDAIDARQPDLAESQNLRGVILMRQKGYAKAETALEKALASDPKFWNARFNLAEIPFLQKNWPEARKRFQDLLNSNASELQGEATQLIQYKILITHLMEGKENMVNALIAKFELAPETPAVQYANAAIALNKKDDAEAKKWLANAEKAFSPQLNKLFAESLYEVGWLEKPAGQSRAALELNTVAERAAQAKAFAKAKFEEAEMALQQRDLTAARKLIEEADAADPNQAPIVNLRGEVLLEQQDYSGAETEFRKAIKADAKFRDAQYNLAQVPFKQKNYAQARERFEQLFATTTGVDKDRAAQLIKFKIYLTYLLENKDARAQKMMEQFQFTGDTPALYYAQAAWEFKRDNATKANEWVSSARKIYPPALNGVFADAFFDLGWLQSPAQAPAVEGSPAAIVADAGQPEAAPSIEPTPLPAVVLAQNTPPTTQDPLTLTPPANVVVPGMEATTSDAEQTPSASVALAAASSPSVETPVASTSSPGAALPVDAKAVAPSEVEAVPAPTAAGSAPSVAVAAATSSPATVLAPAQVREWSEPSLTDRLTSGTVLAGLAFLGGVGILAWLIVSEVRRRLQRASADRPVSGVAREPEFNDDESVGTVEQLVAPTRLAGGPPQVSLQLRASEPALRRAVMPVGKAARLAGSAHGTGSGNGFSHEGNGQGTYAGVVSAPAENLGSTAEAAPIVEPEIAPAVPSFDEGVEESLEVVGEESGPSFSEPAVASAESTVEQFEPEIFEPIFAPEPAFAPAQEFTPEPQFMAPEPAVASAAAADWEETAADAVPEQVAAQPEEFTPWAAAEPIADAEEPAAMEEPEPIASFADPAAEEYEPVGQGQPVPYLTPATSEEISTPRIEIPEEPALPIAAIGAGLAGIGALRESGVDSPASAPNLSSEPMAPQPTTPETMPQPIQPTPAPVIRTGPQPTTPGAMPQPSGGGLQPAGGGMHTAVQLTLSFEIASLQLTPNFKMGSIQLRPTSKVVTMRLAPSQQPQPAMNLQVTFEIASVQGSGNSLGVVRLTPSQQQRPGIISSPSFNIAGLQLVAGADAAPVQLTPSQQGQASVLVTAAFQIATVEFSPSFEISSIILNATSRNVSVQLPGSGPSAVEGAPVFEIGNVQLSGSDIAMMQLNPRGAGAAPKAS